MTTGWVEAVNSLVRSVTTLGLVAGFIWLALVKEIDAGLYSNVTMVVVTWWFATRGNQPQKPADPGAAPGPTNGGPKP